MAHKNYNNIEKRHISKRDLYKVRLTTYIQGDLKNKFMNDCIKRSISEADMMRDIIDLYYSALQNVPDLRDKEIPEIKKHFIKAGSYAKE